jgi:hypothetical protein
MSIAIGCGSAYPGDRLEPALDLAKSGLVDYLSFDRLAERTLAMAQMRKLENPALGHDQQLRRIVAQFAPFISDGKRIVGNFGAANVGAGLREVVDGLRAAGVTGRRVGAIYGDDVLQQVFAENCELPEMKCRVNDVKDKIVSAHAYIGAEPIVELLEGGAHFILGGRLADPSLFVAPICFEMGWSLSDWNKVGVATVAGHLLECGTYVTGACFADPPYRIASDLHRLALPMGVISEDEIIISKLPGTGGVVSAQTVKCQLGYEILDPARYLTPDVTADFTQVEVQDIGPDRVRVRGARGKARPDSLKVLVGIDSGWKTVTEGSFGGPGCITRAKLAEETIRRAIEPFGKDVEEVHFEFHGLTALFGGAPGTVDPADVRIRFAAKCRTAEIAEAVGNEAEVAIYFGPAGGGGVDRRVSKLVGVTPAFLDRRNVNVTTEVHQV